MHCINTLDHWLAVAGTAIGVLGIGIGGLLALWRSSQAKRTGAVLEAFLLVLKEETLTPANDIGHLRLLQKAAPPSSSSPQAN